MKPRLGYALCGSFCTHEKSIRALEELASKYDILPIVSYTVKETDTRFGKASDLLDKLECISGKKVIDSIPLAEPIGPKGMADILVIAPCTGNTLAKLAQGITDTPVTMAAKSHLRCKKPLVIALATNDAMSANLKNLATLLEKKNIYFVPLVQDDIINKPDSLVCDFERLEETVSLAARGIQIRPLFRI